MGDIDYVIDILLIAVIFRQVRQHELTPRSAELPLLLLAAAGVIYLRPPFTLGGNDLALIVVLTVAGIILGTVSGLGDKLRRDQQGRVLDRAGVVSVIAWVLGMGFRFAFAYYAYHSGGPAIARFSVRHDITSAQTWTTALFLMAVGQVVFRVGLLQIRRARAASGPAADAQFPAGPSDSFAS